MGFMYEKAPALPNGKVVDMMLPVSVETARYIYDHPGVKVQLAIICRVNDYLDTYVAHELGRPDDDVRQHLISHQTNTAGAESFTYIGEFK